jgi:hypothetical protein
MYKKMLFISLIVLTAISFFSCKSNTESSDKPIAGEDFTFSIQNFRTYDATNPGVIAFDYTVQTK